MINRIIRNHKIWSDQYTIGLKLPGFSVIQAYQYVFGDEVELLLKKSRAIRVYKLYVNPSMTSNPCEG
jgi:hypothetical protein